MGRPRPFANDMDNVDKTEYKIHNLLYCSNL